MPSAITCRPRLWARPTIERTIAWLSERVDHVGDERAVDLQRVPGEVVQDRQRRVAGAEVVELDADAEIQQLAEHGAHELGVLHQRALGDLEHEARRREGRRRLSAARTSSTRSASVIWRSETLTLTVTLGRDEPARAASR